MTKVYMFPSLMPGTMGVGDYIDGTDPAPFPSSEY